MFRMCALKTVWQMVSSSQTSQLTYREEIQLIRQFQLHVPFLKQLDQYMYTVCMQKLETDKLERHWCILLAVSWLCPKGWRTVTVLLNCCILVIWPSQFMCIAFYESKSLPVIFYLWCRIRPLEQQWQYRLLSDKMFKFDLAPHYLWALEKEKRCTSNMDSGKTFDNTHIIDTELKKFMDNLVWTQYIYTNFGLNHISSTLLFERIVNN